MKILQLTAENVKKLKVVSITPKENVIEVTGVNGSGKSSVLDSIYYALAGAGNIPSKPVRKGEEKAVIKLNLGEVTVIRKFSADGSTSLIVEAANGARFTSPQKMIDELLGKLTFDPLEFSRLEPRKQLEVLRSVVKLEVDLEKLEGLNRADFEDRAELSKKLKMLEGEIQGTNIPEGTPDEEVSVAELVRKVTEVGNKNAELEKERALRKNLQDSINWREEEMNSLLAEEISLQRQLKSIKEKQEASIKAADGLRETLKSLPALYAPQSTDDLEQQIAQAQQVNKQVARKQRRTGLVQQVSSLKNKISELSSAMRGRLDQKQAALAAAQMPVPGLSFGEGEVLFQDLPLQQASSAEQLRVSVSVAMALNPRLRVLRIKDGSLLDESNLQLLREMAEKQDYQIWIERVDSSGKVGIVMEDGEVKESVKEEGAA